MTQRAGQFSADQLVRAIRLFNQAAFELRASAHPTLPLEIALVETTLGEATAPRASAPPVAPPPRVASPPTNPKPAARPAPPTKSAPPNAPNVSAAKASVVQAAPEENTASAPAAAGALSVAMLRDNWARVLAYIRQSNKMAEALLRDAEPIRVEGDQVVLGFHHQLHAERFEKEAKGKAIIERALAHVFQQQCRVKCVLSPERAKRKAVEQDPLIQAAVNQMGAQITEIHEGA
jgi:hypothetical protein